MVSLSFSQFLALYAWFPLALLLLVLLLVARFFERSSGERTFFRLFMVPIIAFGVAAVRYAAVDQIVGDLIADLALTVGGITLSGLSLVLYWRMILQRHAREARETRDSQTS